MHCNFQLYPIAKVFNGWPKCPDLFLHLQNRFFGQNFSFPQNSFLDSSFLHQFILVILPTQFALTHLENFTFLVDLRFLILFLLLLLLLNHYVRLYYCLLLPLNLHFDVLGQLLWTPFSLDWFHPLLSLPESSKGNDSWQEYLLEQLTWSHLFHHHLPSFHCQDI